MSLVLTDAEEAANYPRCAVCCKPVDRWDAWTDMLTEEYVYVAHCHGEREVTRIAREEIVGAEHVSMGGMCFASSPLALPAPVDA